MREWIAAAAGAAALAGAALAVTGAAFFGRKRLRVNRISVALPGLPPAFAGKRLVWFSDVHLGSYYGVDDLRVLARLVNEERPDILGFGGDFAENRRSLRLLPAAVPVLRDMRAELGKFAILGNHDYKASAKYVGEALAEGGFEVLVNRTAALTVGDARLYVAGLDDVLNGRPKLVRVAAAVPRNAAAILLVHEPDPAPNRGEHRFALQLSGHSHGGQARLPFLPPFMTTKYGKKYLAGFYPTACGGVYTSPGVGTTFLPLRLCCPPEIAVITLECADRQPPSSPPTANRP